MEFVTLAPGGPAQNMPVDGAAISTSAAASGNWIPKAGTLATFQLISAAAAEAVIEATNDNATKNGTANNAVLLGTITLAAAGSDGFTTLSDWRYVRCRVTSASAATSALQGV